MMTAKEQLRLALKAIHTVQRVKKAADKTVTKKANGGTNLGNLGKYRKRKKTAAPAAPSSVPTPGREAGNLGTGSETPDRA
jgi:hypothetical protein